VTPTRSSVLSVRRGDGVQYSEMGCEHDTGVLHEELPEDEQPDEEKAMLVFCSRDCLMFHLASFPRVEEE
jgi:hypothetical protein